jgi:hypothetical protein
VRQTAPFTIAPFAVPTSGGEIVLQRGGLLWSSGKSVVKIGSQVIVPPFNDYERIQVTAPPNPAGAVDVTVNPAEGASIGPMTAHSALIYYDPSQPPNQSIAEPFLFPIAFDGPGAYGSQWHTENTLRPLSNDTQFASPIFYRPPCDGCKVKLDGTLTLPPMSRRDGLLLWVLRGTEPYVMVTSRIGEVSRSDSNIGVQVPVVRGKDFKTRFVFPSVPIEPGTRGVLRLWSLDSEPFDVYLDGAALVPGTQAAQIFQRITLTRVSDQEMLFASVDLGALHSPASGMKMTLEILLSSARPLEHFWPMISLTNNETQQVTIFAPQ